MINWHSSWYAKAGDKMPEDGSGLVILAIIYSFSAIIVVTIILRIFYEMAQ